MGDSVEKMTPEGVAVSAVEVLKTAIEGFKSLRESAEAHAIRGNSSIEMQKWDSTIQALIVIERMLEGDVASLAGEKPDFTLEGFRRGLITLHHDCMQNTLRMHRAIEAHEEEIPPRDIQLLRGMAQIALHGCREIPETILKIERMPLTRVV